MDRDGAIVEAAIAAERCTDQKNRRQIRARGPDRLDPIKRCPKHRLLKMQIVIGIAGDGKLGEDHDVDVTA